MGKIASAIGHVMEHQASNHTTAQSNSTPAPAQYHYQQPMYQYGNQGYPAQAGAYYPSAQPGANSQAIPAHLSYPNNTGYQHSYSSPAVLQAHAPAQQQQHPQQSAFSGVGAEIGRKLAVKAGVAIGGALISGLVNDTFGNDNSNNNN
jgi:hypothetical protein